MTVDDGAHAGRAARRLLVTSAAFPLVVVAVGVANVPSVPENAATMPLGTVPPPDVFVPSELIVRSAVAVDEPPGPIAAGDAAALKARYGVAVTDPDTPFGTPGVPKHPPSTGPPAPGPKLQPHQLFVAVTVPTLSKMPLEKAAPFDTIRLRLSVGRSSRTAPTARRPAPTHPPRC